MEKKRAVDEIIQPPKELLSSVMREYYHATSITMGVVLAILSETGHLLSIS